MASEQSEREQARIRGRGPALKLRALVFGPERGYCLLAIIYGVAVGVLTLAVPLCVQVLISSVANIASVRPVIVLSTVLFALLCVSAVLVALQVYLMDLFERRFFCRITAEIVMRNIYGEPGWLERINREELVNRYFEIMVVQKHLPTLLIGGTALVLQATVGFVVVSVYHPFFFFYNLVVAALLYLLLRLWARPAVRTAVEVCNAKYRVARWLEELARANPFFKSERHIAHALERSEQVSADYVRQHARHFRVRFSQIIGLLVLYAGASAVLLGLGGWLVILEQLTLGQLVAAELILSVIFAGLARFGDYLADYYELRAALDKLAYFQDIPPESDRGDVDLPHGPAALEFDRALCHHRGREFAFNFALQPGEVCMAVAGSSFLQKAVLDLVQRNHETPGGQVLFAGRDVMDCRPQSLRDRIAVVDSSGVLECTIAEFLAFGQPGLTRSRMRDMLEHVALDATIDALPEGLDTRLGVFGYPLSRTETLRLKLAAGLLAEPGLVLITEIFDTVPPALRRRIFAWLRTRRSVTVVYFTTRRDVEEFDRYLYLGPGEQPLFDALDTLLEYENQQVGAEAGTTAQLPGLE